MTPEDSMLAVLEESIELSVAELGLNEEFDLAPPMAELVRHANDLSRVVDARAGVKCVEQRLLGHQNKFARTLGAMALRFASQLGEELVAPLLPLLDDAHPWARYHALWALLRSRSLRPELLSALQTMANAPLRDTQPDGAEVKSQQLAAAYLAEVELRRRDVEQLAFEEYLEPAEGLRIRRPVGWAPLETKLQGMRWKLGLVLTHPSELIQLRYTEDPPQVTNMLTVMTGLEDTVLEIARANCPDEWVYEPPVVEPLGERGGWSAVLTSHEVYTVPHLHSIRCFLVKDDTLAIWNSVVPRVDLPLWRGPLEAIARSIVA